MVFANTSTTASQKKLQPFANTVLWSASMNKVIGLIKARLAKRGPDGKKISLRALAREIKVSPSYLHDVINEKRRPGEAICEHFGFTTEGEPIKRGRK